MSLDKLISKSICNNIHTYLRQFSLQSKLFKAEKNKTFPTQLKMNILSKNLRIIFKTKYLKNKARTLTVLLEEFLNKLSNDSFKS